MLDSWTISAKNEFRVTRRQEIDLSAGVPIQRAAVAETTALGAAYLAGLTVGLWQGTAQIAQQWHAAETYEPKMSADHRESLYASWKRAVERARGWVEN